MCTCTIKIHMVPHVLLAKARTLFLLRLSIFTLHWSPIDPSIKKLIDLFIIQYINSFSNSFCSNMKLSSFSSTRLWWGRLVRGHQAVRRLAVCKRPSEDFQRSTVSASDHAVTFLVVSTSDYLRTSDLRDENELAAVDERSHVDAGDSPQWV